ncbi:MAG: hypothetical protein H6Q14_2007 [Bacteroidetes bacterium]|jgi:hypothetical protein|nr:hypothetical protein [Bacteroidota bacterium]
MFESLFPSGIISGLRYILCFSGLTKMYLAQLLD